MGSCSLLAGSHSKILVYGPFISRIKPSLCPCTFSACPASDSWWLWDRLLKLCFMAQPSSQPASSTLCGDSYCIVFCPSCSFQGLYVFWARADPLYALRPFISWTKPTQSLDGCTSWWWRYLSLMDGMARARLGTSCFTSSWSFLCFHMHFSGCSRYSERQWSQYLYLPSRSNNSCDRSNRVKISSSTPIVISFLPTMSTASAQFWAFTLEVGKSFSLLEAEKLTDSSTESSPWRCSMYQRCPTLSKVLNLHRSLSPKLKLPPDTPKCSLWTRRRLCVFLAMTNLKESILYFWSLKILSNLLVIQMCVKLGNIFLSL